MPDQLHAVSGVDVLVCDPDGSPIGADARSITDLLGAASSHGAGWVAVPVPRLAPDFFSLRSGVAGELAQKLTTYRIGLVVVGNVREQLAASSSLRAFVREANIGSSIWFVADLGELADRLAMLTDGR